MRRGGLAFQKADENELSDTESLHSVHSKALREVYLNSADIIKRKKLKKEMRALNRVLYRSEILRIPLFDANFLVDIKKYKELWQEAEEIKDKKQFLTRVKTSSKELHLKYGKKGHRILEFLILKILKEPDFEKELEHAKAFKQLVRILCKSAKKNILTYSFPHPKMKQYEVYFV